MVNLLKRYKTRAGSEVSNLIPVPIGHQRMLKGVYHSGENKITCYWNEDGSYGLRNVPDYLKNNKSDCKLFAITLSNPNSLDLVEV